MQRLLIALVAAVALGVLSSPAVAGDAAKGKIVYDTYCAACHGQTGKGDGPGAAALNPKPRDFTDKAYMDGLADDYVTKLLTQGGAALGKSPLMPPLGAALKERDLQDVISYVRTLAK